MRQKKNSKNSTNTDITGKLRMEEEELNHTSRSYKTLSKTGLIILPPSAKFYLRDE